MKDEIIDLGIAKIKIKQEEVEDMRIVLKTHCPFCPKIITSSTQNQADWNLALHIKQKHQDNEEAEILLKQLEEQRKTN